MTLNLDELRSFLTLASELHFRKAAERLFVSQPALSKQIRKLEEKTGGALFERTRRKVVLREAGRVLIPLAERLLRDSQAALDRVRQATEGRAGTLRIGFGIASASDLLPQTILRFRKTYPGVEIQMPDMSTPAQTRALDRKSTRLNSSHVEISYAVFCLKKKIKKINQRTTRFLTTAVTSPSRNHIYWCGFTYECGTKGVCPRSIFVNRSKNVSYAT